MPSPMRFPPTVEIKRVLAAAMRAGIDIGSVEIHADKIIICPKQEGALAITDYDLWKMSERRDTSLIRHDEESDAHPNKSES